MNWRSVKDDPPSEGQLIAVGEWDAGDFFGDVFVATDVIPDWDYWMPLDYPQPPRRASSQLVTAEGGG